MPNYVNFNSIAPYYEFISQAVFGKNIRQSQIESLRFIPQHSKILIIGGGTGWILEEISKIISSGLAITYIDCSLKMTQLSKKRFHGFNKVEFIIQTVELADLKVQNFDVVITPFFFDCFAQLNMEYIFNIINESLKFNGIWIYTDFSLTKNTKFWHLLTLKTMYIFFRLTCHIEAKKLPSIENCFHNFKLIYEKKYCKDFILSQVYKKEKFIN